MKKFKKKSIILCLSVFCISLISCQHPPNPRLVESHANEDPSSSLFNFKEGVYATVLNQGGSGKVMVITKLLQGENTYERSQELFMSENQTQNLHFIFNEVHSLGGKMTYEVSARAE